MIGLSFQRSGQCIDDDRFACTGWPDNHRGVTSLHGLKELNDLVDLFEEKLLI
jgi:hypothetical protein